MAKSNLRYTCALALLLCCSGCFTVGLWGGSTDGVRGDGEGRLGFSSREADMKVGHWSELFYKIPLTPFALVLDIATSPIQTIIFWSADDC